MNITRAARAIYTSYTSTNQRCGQCLLWHEYIGDLLSVQYLVQRSTYSNMCSSDCAAPSVQIMRCLLRRPMLWCYDHLDTIQFTPLNCCWQQLSGVNQQYISANGLLVLTFTHINQVGRWWAGGTQQVTSDCYRMLYICVKALWDGEEMLWAYQMQYSCCCSMLETCNAIHTSNNNCYTYVSKHTHITAHTNNISMHNIQTHAHIRKYCSLPSLQMMVRYHVVGSTVCVMLRWPQHEREWTDSMSCILPTIISVWQSGVRGQLLMAVWCNPDSLPLHLKIYFVWAYYIKLGCLGASWLQSDYMCVIMYSSCYMDVSNAHGQTLHTYMHTHIYY